MTEPIGEDDSPQLARVRRLADNYLDAVIFEPRPSGAPKWFATPARQVLEAVLYSLGDRADDPKVVSQVLEHPLVPTVAAVLRRGGEVGGRLADQLETALLEAGKGQPILVSAIRVAADIQVNKARLVAQPVAQPAGDTPLL